MVSDTIYPILRENGLLYNQINGKKHLVFQRTITITSSNKSFDIYFISVRFFNVQGNGFDKISGESLQI